MIQEFLLFLITTVPITFVWCIFCLQFFDPLGDFTRDTIYSTLKASIIVGVIIGLIFICDDNSKIVNQDVISLYKYLGIL